MKAEELIQALRDLKKVPGFQVYLEHLKEQREYSNIKLVDYSAKEAELRIAQGEWNAYDFAIDFVDNLIEDLEEELKEE